MNYKFAICDDEKTEIEKISRIINIFAFQIDTGVDIDQFTNGKDLINAYKHNCSYDVIFLDVEMPQMNGIELARFIKSNYDYYTLIIFISNYPEYMQDSFSAHPYYFLQKPVSTEKLLLILNEIKNEYEKNNLQFTLLDNNKKSEIVRLKDIIFIECKNSKYQSLVFHTTQNELETKGKISDWSQKLYQYNFINIYRGIIVNLKYIHIVEKKHLTLTNGISLPISRGKEAIIRDKYINQIIKLQ